MKEPRRSSVILVLAFICTALLVSCGTNPIWYDSPSTNDPSKTATPIPRADPGYIQQLEKKSMLFNSVGMAKIVSGSHLGWRSSASAVSPEELLNYADAWLNINPLMLLVDAKRTTFDYLSDTRFWATMREAGLKGLYVSPTGGSGRLWSVNGTSDGSGKDIVTYDFSDVVGSESRYGKMMQKAIDQHAIVGSDLIPAATGLGPDFFLATRNVREFPGTYCLVEVPQELWSVLPPADNTRMEGTPLSQAALDVLAAKGLLPKAMVDDKNSGVNTGWAATGQISGIDADVRRWVYRYYNTPAYAVLNWEDPSRAANRILSGSAVRQVGMLGQALIGLSFNGFHGLDAAPNSSSHLSSSGLGPAVSAAQSMSREVNRYGGWSWLRDDDLTIEGMRQFLQSGSDFVTDNALSPGAEHALLTGDTSLLKYMADKLIASNIDAKRLVHVMPAETGISYSLPTLRAAIAAGDSKASELYARVNQQYRSVAGAQAAASISRNVLYTTSTGLAAMGLGVAPDNIPQEKVATVMQGHWLLTFFKAMQPGLIMISGQDLVGAMQLSPSTMGQSGDWQPAYASRGTYSLTAVSSTFISSGQSIAKTRNTYPHADEQVLNKTSFLRMIGTTLKKRSEAAISKGRLVMRPETKAAGTIALLTDLQNGKYMLSVCNFSKKTVTETMSLGSIRGSVSSYAGEGSLSGSASAVTITLGPWQGKAILVKGNASGAEEPITSPSKAPTEQTVPLTNDVPVQPEVRAVTPTKVTPSATTSAQKAKAEMPSQPVEPKQQEAVKPVSSTTPVASDSTEKNKASSSETGQPVTKEQPQKAQPERDATPPPWQPRPRPVLKTKNASKSEQATSRVAPRPVQPKPVEPKHVEPRRVEPKPVQPKPEQAASVQSPSQSAPAQVSKPQTVPAQAETHAQSEPPSKPEKKTTQSGVRPPATAVD